MQHIGKLKENIEKAETKEDAKQLIKNADILLNDEKLDQVSGGKDGVDLSAHMPLAFSKAAEEPEPPRTKTCPHCGATLIYEAVFCGSCGGSP